MSPASQSTILQHFSPRRAGESSMGSGRTRAHVERHQSTDSEGSAGVAAIPLSSDRGSPGPSRRASTQRRATQKAIVESDEEPSGDSDVQIVAPPTKRVTAATPRKNPPRRQAGKPAAASAPTRSRRRPPPMDLAKPSRTAAFYIELPSLTAKQKSLYSAGSPSSLTPAAPLAAIEAKGKQRAAEPSSGAVSLKTALKKGSPTRSDSEDLPSTRKNGNRRGKRDDSLDPKRSQRKSRKRPPSDSDSDEPRRLAQRRIKSSQSKKKARRRVRDPDDSGDAETEDEDFAKELEMDEPERFKSQTRLRKKKETAVQRNIRKLKERRDGIVHSTTESESEEETWEYETVSDSEEGFIVDDGGRVEEGLLPHQFSNSSAQTPEFKFKVVFHYLVLLVIKGSKLLPLKGDLAEYFKPQLRDLRRKMEGYRDGRVRSQIWRPRFVQALQTFPVFRTVHLEFAETGCDACNVAAKRSTFRSYLEGGKYDKETHESLDSDSEEDSESSSEEDLPKEFLMGKFCKRRSEVFHSMSHWENQLFQRIRGYYNDLLRAKNKPVPEDSEASSSDESVGSDADDRKADRAVRRQMTADRVARLRRGKLPLDVYNENQVLEWMDARGYQAADYRRLEDLMEQSAMLENDKSKDD